MTEYLEVMPAVANDQAQQPDHTVPVNGHTPESAPPEATVPAALDAVAGNGHGDGAELVNRHAEAGRKGAHRVHQLIREGLLYEKEHGLKRGRQRLRQLIDLGKRYEREHGLSKARKPRRRVSSEQALDAFCEALARLVKPSVRAELLRRLQAMNAANQ